MKLKFLTSLPVVAVVIVSGLFAVTYANSADTCRAIIGSIVKGMLVLSLLILFPVSFVMARHVGEVRAKEMRMGRYSSKTVRFVFKQNLRNRYPVEFIAANDSGMLKLLTHTKDTYFVFLQVLNTTPQSAAIPFGYAYHVARTDADLISVEMRDFSKTGVSDQ
jgi:hypothetical protein